jgi:hypothetical protein
MHRFWAAPQSAEAQRSGLTRASVIVGTSGPFVGQTAASPNARNSGRFGTFSTFILLIFRICATLFSRNDNAAERAQVNEADNGNEEGSGRNGGVDAREATQGDWASKNKTTLRISASP